MVLWFDLLRFEDLIPRFPNLIIIRIQLQRATGLIISFCPRSTTFGGISSFCESMKCPGNPLHLAVI